MPSGIPAQILQGISAVNSSQTLTFDTAPIDPDSPLYISVETSGIATGNPQLYITDDATGETLFVGGQPINLANTIAAAGFFAVLMPDEGGYWQNHRGAFGGMRSRRGLRNITCIVTACGVGVTSTIWFSGERPL